MRVDELLGRHRRPRRGLVVAGDGVELGIARGAAELADDRVTVDELVIGDPARPDPGCRLLLRVADDDAG